MPLPVSLFSSRICGWAKRNYAALLEKETAFELVPANDLEGNKTTSFLSLSPARKTPVLVHEQAVVWESRIINEYIEERFSGNRLMPPDPGQRARARSLNCYCDATLMPLISRIARADVITTELTELNESVAALDRFGLPGGDSGPYWAGSSFSLVDICYLNFFDNLDYLSKEIDGLDLRLSQGLKEWGAAITQRPSVARAAEIAKDFAVNEVRTVIQP